MSCGEPAVPTALRPPPRIALMVCPLCLEESGRRIAILAEFALGSDPVVTVVQIVGCQHGARFAQTGGLTSSEQRRMTQAALEMWDAARREERGAVASPGAPSDPFPHAAVMCAPIRGRDRGFRCEADRPPRAPRGRQRTR